jgi:tetratricopeptide (TPR) repeat protein
MDMGSMGPAKGSGGMSMTAEDIEKAFKQFDSMDDLIALGNQHLDEARGEAGDISAESAEQRFMIAVGAYERALELEPGDANIITDLGIAYRGLGDPKMAVEKFREAAAADPDHVQSRFNAGLVLEADLEDMTGAAEAWKDYLEVAPKDDSRREEIEAKLRDMN